MKRAICEPQPAAQRSKRQKRAGLTFKVGPNGVIEVSENSINIAFDILITFAANLSLASAFAPFYELIQLYIYIDY